MSKPIRRDGYWLWVGGPVPPGSVGITLGRVVSVRRSAVQTSSFDELLRHELVHVDQFAELGWPRFFARYVASYVRFRMRGYGHQQSYVRIPLEVEARVAARWASQGTFVHGISEAAGMPAVVGRI